MIEWYSEGYLDVEVAAKLKLPYKEFQKRCQDDSLFNELVTFGRLACKAWWLSTGRKAVRAGAPAQSFAFWHAFMKNEFGWSEKTEIKTDQADAKDMSTDEIQAKLAVLKSKLAKKPNSVQLQEVLSATPTII